MFYMSKWFAAKLVLNLDKTNIIKFIRNECAWCFSDHASWIDYILITILMHWLLFIHKIPFSSTCFEAQVLIFRRIQLYTCSIWYCHSLREFLVACRYTACVSSHSNCVPTGHHELSQRVTVPYAACVQLYPPEDEHLSLETCTGEWYFMNK